MHFWSPSDHSQTAAPEAKPGYIKTKWSEFQKPSPTAAMQGEAELRILDFKITWSEFQKPCQTCYARQSQATYTYTILKNIIFPDSALLTKAVEFFLPQILTVYNFPALNSQ